MLLLRHGRDARGNLGPILVLTIALHASLTGQTAQTKRATLGPVLKVGNGLYQISYRYDFFDKKSVYIAGVGQVGPRGKLKYLSSDSVLQFWDQPGGTLLLTLPLTEPEQMMGAPTIEIPDPEKFPEASHRGRWNKPQPFPENAFAVLEHYFPLGYKVYQEQNQNHYLTSWCDLPELPDHLYGQVAVLLSHPAKKDVEDLVEFTVRFKARERRSLTDWRDSIGPQVQSRLEKYISDLMAKLQQGGLK
jgi:hypothetical protein